MNEWMKNYREKHMTTDEYRITDNYLVALIVVKLD